MRPKWQKIKIIHILKVYCPRIKTRLPCKKSAKPFSRKYNSSYSDIQKLFLIIRLNLIKPIIWTDTYFGSIRSFFYWSDGSESTIESFKDLHEGSRKEDTVQTDTEKYERKKRARSKRSLKYISHWSIVFRL